MPARRGFPGLSRRFPSVLSIRFGIISDRRGISRYWERSPAGRHLRGEQRWCPRVRSPEQNEGGQPASIRRMRPFNAHARFCISSFLRPGPAAKHCVDRSKNESLRNSRAQGKTLDRASGRRLNGQISAAAAHDHTDRRRLQIFVSLPSQNERVLPHAAAAVRPACDLQTQVPPTHRC